LLIISIGFAYSHATVPHIVALLGFAFLLRISAIQASLIALDLSSVGFSFHDAKIRSFPITSKFFFLFLWPFPIFFLTLPSL
jgi:hypothetical protein